MVDRVTGHPCSGPGLADDHGRPGAHVGSTPSVRTLNLARKVVLPFGKPLKISLRSLRLSLVCRLIATATKWFPPTGIKAAPERLPQIRACPVPDCRRRLVALEASRLSCPPEEDECGGAADVIEAGDVLVRLHVETANL